MDAVYSDTAGSFFWVFEFYRWYGGAFKGMGVGLQHTQLTHSAHNA